MIHKSKLLHRDDNKDTSLHDENCKQTNEISVIYCLLQKGIDDISLGNTRPFAEAMADVKVKRAK